jgi:hypothetical protein
MTTYRQIDEPAPTIVGPRPAEGAGGRLKIPQGLERLLTLAGISAEWRGRVLADPFGAAAEAKIELSESEGAILKSIPKPALEAMAGSFARRHGGVSFGKLAAGAAAAALLAGTAYAAAPGAGGGIRADEPPPPPAKEGLPAPTGIRPDVPEEAPAVLWMTALDDALTQAKKSNRAVMAIFLSAGAARAEEMPIEVAGARAYVASQAEKSQKICLSESKDYRAAVKNADLVAVKLAKPAKPREFTKDDTAEQIAQLEAEHKAYEKASKVYEEAFKKYALDAKKLPAVVWLAPDGSELSKVVQPDDEAVFVKLIKEVPPQLAKWITQQRKREELQPAVIGDRVDKPVTKGIRPDVPEGKL